MVVVRWFKRMVVILAGVLVILLGLLILPLPGPFGAPTMLLGLAILGSEIPRARRWRENLFKRFQNRKQSAKDEAA